MTLTAWAGTPEQLTFLMPLRTRASLPHSKKSSLEDWGRRARRRRAKNAVAFIGTDEEVGLSGGRGCITDSVTVQDGGSLLPKKRQKNSRHHSGDRIRSERRERAFFAVRRVHCHLRNHTDHILSFPILSLPCNFVLLE